MALHPSSLPFFIYHENLRTQGKPPRFPCLGRLWCCRLTQSHWGQEPTDNTHFLLSWLLLPTNRKGQGHSDQKQGSTSTPNDRLPRVFSTPETKTM